MRGLLSRAFLFSIKRMKVIQKHNDCIGCGACTAVCPAFWEMPDDGKARPVNGKQNENGDYELEIEDKDIACNKEASEVCPVQVIFLRG